MLWATVEKHLLVDMGQLVETPKEFGPQTNRFFHPVMMACISRKVRRKGLGKGRTVSRLSSLHSPFDSARIMMQNVSRSSDDIASPVTSPLVRRAADAKQPMQSSGSLTNVFLADGSVLDATIGIAQMDISAAVSIGVAKNQPSASLKLRKKVADSRKGQITRCHFSTSNSLVYSTSMDGSLCVYDAVSEQFTARIKVHAAGITDMDVSPTHELAVTTIADGKVHLIDLVNKKRLQVWDTVSRSATAVRFEPNEASHVCFGDETGTLTLLSLKNPSTPPFKTQSLVNGATFGSITALCWSGRYIFVGDSAGKVAIMAFDSGNNSLRLMRYGVYKSKVSGLVHSPKYNLLIVNTANNHMHVVDGTSLSLIRVFTRPNDSGDIRSCFLDDQTVVSGSDDGSVYVFDVKTGELVTLGVGGHGQPVPSVDCSADRKLLCSVTTSEICIWESQQLL